MEKKVEAAVGKAGSVSPGSRPYPVSPRSDQPRNAPPSVGPADGIDVLQDGVRGWGSVSAVGRIGDGGEGNGLDRKRRQVAGVSREEVLATGKRKKQNEREPGETCSGKYWYPGV